jgi:hypothetical protein
LRCVLNLLPEQQQKSSIGGNSDTASVRFFFAKIRGFERYGDFSPTDNIRPFRVAKPADCYLDPG